MPLLCAQLACFRLVRMQILFCEPVLLAGSRVLVGHCELCAHYLPFFCLFLARWRRKRYGRYGGRHTNLKFGMAVPYQSDEIWAIDSQENR